MKLRSLWETERQILLLKAPRILTTFLSSQEISIFQLSRMLFEKGWFRTAYPGVEAFFDPGAISCDQL